VSVRDVDRDAVATHHETNGHFRFVLVPGRYTVVVAFDGDPQASSVTRDITLHRGTVTAIGNLGPTVP